MDERRKGTNPPPPRPRDDSWRDALGRLTSTSAAEVDHLADAIQGSRPQGLRYHLNIRESRLRDRLVIDLFADGPKREPVSIADGPVDREARKSMPASGARSKAQHPDGRQGRLHRPDTRQEPRIVQLDQLCSEDVELVGLMFGAQAESRSQARLVRKGMSRFVIRPSLYQLLLPQLTRNGRWFADLNVLGVEPSGPLRFAGSKAFEVRLSVRREPEEYVMNGALVREGEKYGLEQPKLLLSDGFALVDHEALIVQGGVHLDWAHRLRRHGAVRFPPKAKDSFVSELVRMPDLPPIDLPPEFHWTQVSASPRPKVVFSPPDEEEEDGPINHLCAQVLFEYEGVSVSVNSREAAVVDKEGRRMFRRNLPEERAHLERLKPLQLGIASAQGELALPRKTLAEVVKGLIEAGWSVESDGAEVLAGAFFQAKVESGIDWFDLDASAVFPGGSKAKLPALLAAAKASAVFVRCQDGKMGLVPRWMKKVKAFAELGSVQADRLRFTPSQAGVIDVLLAGHDHADVDVRFEMLRAQLQEAANPEKIQEPEGFKGKLRDYQKAGVAWMRFLESNDYGGCLADDMGLGKTVQMLCVLQARHAQSSIPPSLVVVPKSLIHNWVSEAAKFTTLKVVDFTGPQRMQHRDQLEDYDLIVTTYGTLRQEILRLTEIRFASVILDEAQAIKNPKSQAAKACRLLQADHRLAISGTPIENGIEELWSLFEFLNPGMLGSLTGFSGLSKQKDVAWLEDLSAAIKPFMLRRTKEQVLHELPPKSIQVWDVPMGEDEQKEYDRLKAYYRRSLEGVLEAGPQNTVVAPKEKVHVLEALLRLRQAACHPGLIDPNRLDEGSAKIDAVIEKLEQIIPQGHKVLIFSQFTSLLEIVRRRLAKLKIGYAYLDGGTQDRKKTVSQFTDNEDCAVFLISLKAGGCGLNLTQSDYVFILDPWWNPAIEAQAIDRAHRMGQKNKVFAYKMVSQGSVEEKIVALQGKKRRLADTVVTADTGPLQGLTIKDLAELLGDAPVTR